MKNWPKLTYDMEVLGRAGAAVNYLSGWQGCVGRVRAAGSLLQGGMDVQQQV